MQNITLPIDAAISYAMRGWHVFPLFTPLEGVCDCPDTYKARGDCTPGKHPRTKNGDKDASADLAKVERWWKIFPQANVGLGLGPSGLLSVAPDSVEWHMRFISNGLPPTFTFASGGGDGHMHYLYLAPPGLKLRRLCRKGEYDILPAGYVVMPPSMHESGRAYRVIDDRAPVAAPHWVTATLVDAARKPRAPRQPVEGDVLDDEAFNRLIERIDPDIWEGRVYGDRSTGLNAIVGDAAKLGANIPTLIEIARERDITLGWRKYTDRSDVEVRYREMAERQYERNPPSVRLNGRVRAEPEPEPEAVEWRLQGDIPEPPVDVLPEACRAVIESSSLPPELLLGAFGAALDTAIGGVPEIAYGVKRERAITWTALLGATGSGKSPAVQDVFGPLVVEDGRRFKSYLRELADWNDRLEHASDKRTFKDSEPQPVARVKHIEDVTPEALHTDLAEYASRGLWFDELKGIATLMGEYKRVRAADEARLLRLWTGVSFTVRRMSGKRLDVQRPTVVICGPLTPADHRLLGQAGDGMRARWLPHIARSRAPVPMRPASQASIDDWERLARRLLDREAEYRYWVLDLAAEALFVEHEARWAATLTFNDPPKQVEVALAKASTHLLRISLRLAEAEAWSVDGRMTIGPEVVERAARWVDYCLACWWAMPEGEVLGIGRVTEKLDPVLDEVQAYVEGPKARHHLDADGWLPSRLLRRFGVAGIQTGVEAKAVLARWKARYPAAYREGTPAGGGPTGAWIRSPRRAT